MNMPLGGDPKPNQLRKIQMLIDRNANLNRVDEFGFTPLMDAAMNEQPKVVLMLLRAKATTDGIVKEGHHKGQTFWTLAKQHPAVMNAIAQYNREAKQTIQEKASEALQGVV